MLPSRAGRTLSAFTPQILMLTVILFLCSSVCTTKYPGFSLLLGVEKCVMVYYKLVLSKMVFLYVFFAPHISYVFSSTCWWNFLLSEVWSRCQDLTSRPVNICND